MYSPDEDCNYVSCIDEKISFIFTYVSKTSIKLTFWVMHTMVTNKKAATNAASAEFLRTRLHRPLRTRLVQNFLLVCLDESIDEINNKDCRDSIQKLRQLANEVKTFTDANECVEYIDGIQEEKTFVICSDAFGQATVPFIHDKLQVYTIYIFSDDPTRYEKWVQDWSKVKDIFTDITPIYESLKQTA